jgi:1-phosphatidylinositol-4-phosphate 5-kinase
MTRSAFSGSGSDDESSEPEDDILDRGFRDTRRFDFPRHGSPTTPAHQMGSFTFKDYCRPIFATLREWFGITPEMYLVKLCGGYKLLEFISNSKSGQFFFYSYDGEFLIKSMTQAECKFLRRILPDYYRYVERQPDTLITKFYGMYRVKPHGRKAIYFVVMGSVFHTDKEIHRIYDLKGSTQGRTASAKDKEQEVPVLKDNDFLDDRMFIRIGKVMSKKLKDQLRSDSDFLKALNIMDYSVLLGLHYTDGNPLKKGGVSSDEESEEEDDIVKRKRSFKKTKTHGVLGGGLTRGKSRTVTGKSPSRSPRRMTEDATSSPPPLSIADAVADEKMMELAESRTSEAAASPVSSEFDDMETPAFDRLEVRGRLKRRLSTMGKAGTDKVSRPGDISEMLGVKELVVETAIVSDEFEVQHPSVFQKFHGGICEEVQDASEPPSVIYYCGIIDILQAFDKRKKMEYRMKGLKYDTKTISSVPPDQYAKRMVDFLKDKIL